MYASKNLPAVLLVQSTSNNKFTSNLVFDFDFDLIPKSLKFLGAEASFRFHLIFVKRIVVWPERWSLNAKTFPQFKVIDSHTQKKLKKTISKLSNCRSRTPIQWECMQNQPKSKNNANSCHFAIYCSHLRPNLSTSIQFNWQSNNNNSVLNALLLYLSFRQSSPFSWTWYIQIVARSIYEFSSRLL